jgi:hypothetical protein
VPTYFHLSQEDNARRIAGERYQLCTISGHYPQVGNAEDNGEHREFVAPWSVEAIAGGFKVIDANGQSLAYVYGVDPHDAATAKAPTLDEARRIAANIAKPPSLLTKGS